MYRKIWTIPDRVFDILDSYPEKIEVEVIRLIRAYHRFFDEYGTDNGFAPDGVSATAQAVFWRVYDELHDADMKYAQKCAVLSENGKKGVEARSKKKERKEAKKKWYRENREKVAQSRKKQRQKVSNNFDALSNTLSNNGAQSQADSQLQKAEANGYRQYSLNNIPTLHSGILLERGFGGKPSYAQEVVDNVEPNSNRTSGLSCSKAEQPARSTPFAGSEAVSGSVGQLRQYEQFGITDRWQSGRAAVEADVAVSAPRMQSSASSARKDDAANRVCLPSAPHSPRVGEVLITKSFSIDFDDPVFQPYFRADKFLRRALNEWLIKNKIGCSVEKRWIAEQLVKFARRQGKEKVLMGVVEDE